MSIFRLPFRRRRTKPATWSAADAEAFLRAGGTFALDEWMAFSPETREAFAAVAQAIDADRIATLALAVQDRGAALALLGPQDGGRAQEEHLLGSCIAAARARAIGALRASPGKDAK